MNSAGMLIQSAHNENWILMIPILGWTEGDWLPCPAKGTKYTTSISSPTTWELMPLVTFPTIVSSSEARHGQKLLVLGVDLEFMAQDVLQVASCRKTFP